MNYCSNCGESLSFCTPPGDDRPRFVCNSCGTIHYQNPLMVVGCIPEVENKILMCRRSIEPCAGKWTLPAGYLENGESVCAGAARETYEEACARVEIIAPYAIYNIRHVSQIYLMFRARLVGNDFKPGSETEEVKLFREKEIPWNEIAFTVITKVLRNYFRDRAAGEFPFHIGDVLPKT